MFLLLHLQKPKKMRNNRISFLLICGLLLLAVSSCLRDYDYDYDDWMLSNAQISYFSLFNDSIPGLNDLEFAIDQVNSKIYNADSMPYGTELRFKVLIDTISLEVGAYSTYFMPLATGDTILDPTTDSVDFSQPVMIEITAYDGVTKKLYEAKLNIHQTDPDSMAWELLASLLNNDNLTSFKAIAFDDKYYFYAIDADNGNCMLYISDTVMRQPMTQYLAATFPGNAVIDQLTKYAGALYVPTETGALFASTDGVIWSPVVGAPVVKALMGSLEASLSGSASALAAVIDGGDGGSLRFATMNEAQTWQTGSAIPDAFPVNGFAALTYEQMYYSRLTVAAGRNADGLSTGFVWSTMDGLTWAQLSNGKDAFLRRRNASIVNYDNHLFLVGGIDANGRPLRDIYCSRDGGVNWTEYDYPLPTEFPAAGYRSALVTYDNYILLFGGKAGALEKVYNTCWRGRINRLGW